jgi:O-methyltransferase involved in polyketide biosynthesis
MSEIFSPTALATGVSANAAYDGLKFIATVAVRRRREQAWAKALVDEVAAANPGLLQGSEPRRLAKWLVDVGLSAVQHGTEEAAARLLRALHDRVLASAAFWAALKEG